MFTKKTIIIMSIAIGVLLIFIAGLLIWKNYFSSETAPENTPAAEIESVPASSLEKGKQETKNLVDEIKQLADGKDPDKIAQIITVTRTDKNGSSTDEQAAVVAPLSNPISMETGEVLTRDGGANAKEGARPGDSDGVVQSGSIDPTKLPESTIKINVLSTAITPAEFSVSPGQAVSLAVTAVDTLEVFRFASPELSAVAAGIKAGGTIVLTFNAPLKVGEYIYYSDYLDHRAQGAVGKMIVK